MRNGMSSLYDNRPHPCLLPREREDHSLSLSNSGDWIRRMVFHKPESVRKLFPLPGGEGQGEGERFH